ncbi:type I-E CRISPR-associated protein Cas6/Cse3/CasE [Pseudodesulfovibrio indicus]|uniref:type I-E CRISPR-associated protein Cas6/Cse3/CasE n=1 Tax=Pseudodesulfovibrio indicus TaxID=1716143 RepID=UPI00292CF922|nr:type I-E CRISPR-associated protein Cas6/Cse3/CasE [Pseudodesulfovibrio indicus]
MYMSKLTFDPVCIARQGIYDAHQALWTVFSDDPDRRRDFLYRRLDERTFLTVSDREPLHRDGLLRCEVKEYAPRLKAGDRVYFSLRFNPVVKRRDDKGRQVRVDLVQDRRRRLAEQGVSPDGLPPWHVVAEEAARDWFAGRRDSLGLEVGDVLVEAYCTETFARRRGERAISLARIDAGGFARVTDPARLVESLRRGVGCAKGFGFGLLLLRRA